MFGLIKINDIGNKTTLKDKLVDCEVIGVFDSLVEIEAKYKDYFIRKYSLLRSFWCFLSRKNVSYQLYSDIDFHKFSDMILIDLESFGNSKDIEVNEFKSIIRELKISLLYDKA